VEARFSAPVHTGPGGSPNLLYNVYYKDKDIGMANVQKEINVIDLGERQYPRYIDGKGKDKDKVKFTLEQTTKAQREIRNLLYSFFNLGARYGGWYAGKTGYALCNRLGGSQARFRRVRKTSPPTGIRSLDRPARCESLYRLSCLLRMTMVIYSCAESEECDSTRKRISQLFKYNRTPIIRIINPDIPDQLMTLGFIIQ